MRRGEQTEWLPSQIWDTGLFPGEVWGFGLEWWPPADDILIFDLWKARDHEPVIIRDSEIMQVCSYMYLGIHIDSRTSRIVHNENLFYRNFLQIRGGWATRGLDRCGEAEPSLEQQHSALCAQQCCLSFSWNVMQVNNTYLSKYLREYVQCIE